MTNQHVLHLFILCGLIINPNLMILPSTNEENERNFSIYNTNGIGCSSYREVLESQGYEVMSINSSLNTLKLLNKSICLVLLDPNKFYDPIYDVPFFIDFLNDNTKKNSLLIAHEYGSTHQLLWDIFLANLLNWENLDPDNIFPITILPDGTLLDYESCLTNPSGQEIPSCPIITEFDTIHPTISGVSQVLLSNASAAAGGQLLIEDIFGWDVIGKASFASFVDMNDNGMYDYDNTTENYADSIDLSMVCVPLDGVGFDGFDNQSDFKHVPLGGSAFIPAVFLAKELQNNRIFVTSDASCFSNELIYEYDDLQFGLNIIDWLAYNGIDDPDDWVIVFDETHANTEDSKNSISTGIILFFLSISGISLISGIIFLKRLEINNQP